MSIKKAIKKIIHYDQLYDTLKTSFLYQGWKRINGKIANFINGNPSKDFFIIGVTGTNGKTTTCNLLHKMLNELLAPTVMISTACIKIGDETLLNDKKMTSLDTYQLQSILAKAKAAGCKIAVLEASSQGLDQNRFEGVTFDYAILTNITRDHLDYHKDMEDYTLAKKKLFKYVLANKKDSKYASFPADDKIGRERDDEMAFDKKITYSLQKTAMLQAENIKEGEDETTFDVKYLGNAYHTTIKLLGSYNVYNFLAALSVGIQIGLDIQLCIDSLSEFDGVSGRMEKVQSNGVNYFVDFAHDPDALDKTLTYLHKIKGNNKLILVFGAPGNRDKLKRPEMGKIGRHYSDIIIATDDDPDTENRLSILRQLSEEIDYHNNANKEFYIIPERELAIKFAIDCATPGDIVMLAGKGHEPIQWTNFGTRKRNDKEELQKLLKSKE